MSTVSSEGGDPSPTKRWAAIAIAILVVAVAGVGIAVVWDRGGSPAQADVALLPASDPGPDAFTDSVTVGRAGAFPDSVQVVAASTRGGLEPDGATKALVAVGTTPGLYGGTGDAKACDPQKLVAFLADNPSKARAWAGVIGIAPSGIERFVGGLTPVILTSDTLVGNHGYRGGKATSLTSVLQAGTAVMVDATGTPRVKCNCGNPLTAPEPLAAPPAGAKGAWEGYNPGVVVRVRAGKPATSFEVIDVESGETYDQPVAAAPAKAPATPATTKGGWVSVQQPAAPGSTPATGPSTIATSTDGKTWASVARIDGESILGLAHGDGRWLAVGNRAGTTEGQVYASEDLRTWKQIATLPDQLSGLAYGKGRWVATGTTAISPAVPTGTPHFAAVSYTSTDGTRWSKTGLSAATNASLTVPVAFDGDAWLTATGGFELTGGNGFALSLYRSTDGSHWTPTGATVSGSTDAVLAYGDGRWNLGTTPSYGTGTFEPGALTGPLITSTDGKTWAKQQQSEEGLPNGDFAVTAIAAGDGRWIAEFPSDPSGRGDATFLVSEDGKTWAPAGSLSATVSALAYGPVP